MKKSYKLENLCCANCAAKMERKIKKMDGITNADIAFMTQRLNIETEGEPDEILDEVQKVISKIEKDCRIIR